MTGMPAPGPQSAASIETFKFKYCQKGETYRDVCNRVASVLADHDGHFREFRGIMLDGRFSPAGRMLSSLGTTKKVTPYNCFVSGPIEDKLRGPGSILNRFDEAAETMRRGGGIGYDFSNIRPRNSLIRSLDSHSSGPVGFLEMYNVLGSVIASTGERRGAQMGILRVDHPDIEEFILAKQNGDRLTRFNLSIAITDAFMQAVEEETEFPLQFEGRVHKMVDAETLFETIMRSTWDWGEPGVVFIDTINRENNLQYCETIGATNPCSEQPLPPFGACLLGSFNLARYLVPAPYPTPLTSRYQLDYLQLAKDVGPVVRALDNVVDVAFYPIPEQRQSAIATRRMGLGLMGVANALEACGFPYGTSGFIDELDKVLTVLKNEAYWQSAGLAKEKGPFPLYKEEYLRRPFVTELGSKVQNAIKEHGIRNSHLISMAPTGTISFCMGHVSSGIEPVYSISTERIVQMPDGPVKYQTFDYAYTHLGVQPRTAMEITPKEHVDVLKAVQKHVDSAVSKTVNVPSNCPWDDFKELYMDAWKGGAKGCATYTSGGKREGLLEAKSLADCEGGSCAVE